MKITQPMETVIFQLPEASIFRPGWEVTLNDDGSLMVFTHGRNQGRLLVEPRSNSSIRVTTDRLTRKEAA